MRAGCFVGRVGGLAVALGVGVAVASSPGVAWAEDGSSPGADSASPSSTAAGGHRWRGGPAGLDPPNPRAPRRPSEPLLNPRAQSNLRGRRDEGRLHAGSDSVDASESGTSASGGAAVRQVPPGMAISTGGADPSTTSNSETSAIGDVAAALTTDDSTLPKPVADLDGEGPRGAGRHDGTGGRREGQLD